MAEKDGSLPPEVSTRRSQVALFWAGVLSLAGIVVLVVVGFGVLEALVVAFFVFAIVTIGLRRSMSLPETPEGADGPVGSEWSRDLDGAVYGGVTVADGSVYATTAAGTVYAFDPEDGSIEWRYETGDRMECTPTVVDGTVYVGAFDGVCYALDADRGTERWTVDTSGLVSGSRIYDGVAVVESTVLVGAVVGNAGRLYGVSARDGSERWDFETRAVHGSPAVVGDRVVVGADAGVYCLYGSSGNEVWHADHDGAEKATPAVADGTVYVPSVGGSLAAFDVDDGVRKWIHETDAGWGIEGRPAVDTEHVYVGCHDGSVSCLDAWDGSEVWEFETEGPVSAGPVLANETLYVPSYDGSVYAIDPDGEQVWRYGLGESVHGTPAVDGDRVFVATTDGTLHAMTDQRSGVPPARTEAREPTATPADATASTEPDASPPTATTGTTDGDRPPEVVPDAPSLSLDYGDFEEGEPLGRGGTADVYRATVTGDGERYRLAIKEPRFQETMAAEAVERFEEEARTWAKLDDHDHVVSVVDYGLEPLPWLAMEYMDAGHLGDRAGTVALDEGLWMATRVADALLAAHRRGVVHLDVKPENVLFRSTDEWAVPKVADWGLAKLLLEHSQSVEGMTPHYAAPEQLDETFGSVDQSTDVYQLGATLYELFTGRPPHTGRTARVVRQVLDGEVTPPTEVDDDLPTALDDVLLTALATEKADRYEDLIYVRDALAEVRDDVA